jgi:glycosyltransferase involved in cell wall biosynthesis
MIGYVPQRHSGPTSIGMLSTHPPTICGLASFNAALAGGLVANGAAVNVVRVAGGQPSSDARVVGELVNGSAASIEACADLLNQNRLVLIQHDFDIYGGADGLELVALMEALNVPSIVVAHDIPADPTPSQRSVLEAVAALADRMIVMSDSASERLCNVFNVERRKVVTITHGATIPSGERVKRAGRPTILSWGLLGPGKGIERVIDAMASLRELRGQPQYLIAGATHPKVLAAEGEAYREGLAEQVQRNGLTGAVKFEPGYRSAAALAALVQSCAVVVLPFDSTDQVTSGVLVNAVASGRPVVATAFPHAIEMLGSGAGIVVDKDDPDALVSALKHVLADPRLAGSMAAEGRRLAPSLAWSTVASSYLALAQRLFSERRALV